MTSTDFDRFFEAATGHPPFPYQRRLALGDWPQLLDVPTGLGKTAAVVLAWLWKRHQGDPGTGRRLVYCLPMRTLVRQTADAARRWTEAAGSAATVHVLLGGDVDQTWDVEPDRDHVLVGTQDLLLSRALGRGYAMSRYRWPVHFGLLNNDCLWVYDETQLMGVGVETGAQLDGLRTKLGARGPARSLWMSATLGEGQLATVDHPRPQDGWHRHRLTPEDHEADVVRRRVGARKRLLREDLTLTADGEDDYVSTVAERVLAAAADRGGLTLAVVNRVDRAQRIFAELRERTETRTALVHSRFRPPDRDEQQEILTEDDGDRIVVATQAVEAGLDVSARTLFTELAPWPSLVQRFGRCNRYGEADGGGEIRWLPIDTEDEGLALPYGTGELAVAADLLAGLEAGDGDVGPASLRAVEHVPEPKVRPVVRRRDVLQLFDTTPDLLGRDVDVSRFVRDEDDTDARFFWRSFEAPRPTAEEVSEPPARDELVAVSIRAANDFLGKLAKARKKLFKKAGQRDAARQLQGWRWDPLAERWQGTDRARPGDVLLLHSRAGGYDPALGWTGKIGEPVDESSAPRTEIDAMDRDPGSLGPGPWVELTDHLDHVAAETRRLTASLGVEPPFAEALVEAARWHDAGKAHPEFQHRLTAPVAGTPERAPREGALWAKSNHRKRARSERRYFRHELASALAWLQLGPQVSPLADDPRQASLIAFLIAAHHGKVRLSIRSVPDEQRQRTPTVRGLAEGDRLPVVQLPGGLALPGVVLPEVALTLEPVRLGGGSWQGRMLALRDDPDLGPFRLAWLEAVLRAADSVASRAEREEDENA